MTGSSKNRSSSRRAVSKPAKPAARGSLGPRGDADVIVLGAGVAGLAVAAELSARGLRVIVVEARDRIGGRVWTVRDDRAPLPIELGAEFVHGPAPSTIAIAEAAGLALVEVPVSHWLRQRGALQEAPAYAETIGRALKRTARIVRDRGDRSFAQALAEARVREPARSRAFSYVEGYNAAPAEEISARALASGDLGRDRIRRVVAGFDEIARSLGKRMKRGALRLNTIVTEVRWKRSSVEVVCRTPGGRATGPLRAPRIVVTLPASLLKPVTRGGPMVRFTSGEPAVRFAPALPEKARALAKLAMGSVVRINFLFRDAFWGDRSIVRARKSADLAHIAFLHALGEPLPTWWTSYPLHAPVLTAWAGGPTAEALAPISDAAIVERALGSLASALGVPRALVRDRLIDCRRHDWTSDPFARGAYSYPLVGGHDAARELAKPVEGTLFFAGEATASPPDNGTVDGALASGERAAREVLESLDVGRPGARKRTRKT